MKQRPEGCEGVGLGRRAFQLEGTGCAKAPRRSGEAPRWYSHVDHRQGFAFCAEQAGKPVEGLVQKSNMI